MKEEKETRTFEDAGTTPDNKKGNPGKKGTPNGKKKSSGKEGKKGGGDRPPKNDPQWWYLNDTIKQLVGNVSMNNLQGLPNDQLKFEAIYEGFETSYSGKVADRFVQPGILQLRVAPTLGISTGAESAINVAAINLRQYLRKVNSGAANNYEAMDPIITLLAVCECYKFYYVFKRACGVAKLYSQLNRYIPGVLHRSLGLSDDLFANVTPLIDYVNAFATKLANIPVPKDLTIIKKYKEMFTNIYAHDALAQDGVITHFYEYVPDGFWHYNEYAAEYGSCLIYEPLSDNAFKKGMSIENIRTLGESLIRVLIDNDDIGNISGDVLKAFETETERPEFVSYEYVTPLVTNDWLTLTCFKNATVVPGRNFFDVTVRDSQGNDVDRNSNSVFQMSGKRLVYEPRVRIGSEWIPTNHGYYFDAVSPSPENVIEVSTLKLTGHGGTAGIFPVPVGQEDEGSLHLDTTGCAIVMQVNVFCRNSNPTNPVDIIRFQPVERLTYQSTSEFTDDVVYVNEVINTIANMSKYTQFYYAPPRHIAFIDGADNALMRRALPTDEIHLFRAMDSEWLQRLQNQMHLSIWKIPAMGVYSIGELKK